MRIQVVIPDQLADEVQTLAQEQHRPFRNQAEWILLQAIEQAVAARSVRSGEVFAQEGDPHAKQHR